MIELALGLSLLTAIDSAIDMVVQERLVHGCVASVLPSEAWEKAVWAEMDRRGWDSGEQFDVMMQRYGDMAVPFLSHLFRDRFTQEERLWIASAACCGRQTRAEVLREIRLQIQLVWRRMVAPS